MTIYVIMVFKKFHPHGSFIDIGKDKFYEMVLIMGKINGMKLMGLIDHDEMGSFSSP